MKSSSANFRRLESDKIIETVKALRGRIEERFPGSGLGKVVGELQEVAEETVGRTRWIQKPHLLLRCVAALLSLGIIALLAFLVAHVHQFNFEDFTNSVQALDSSISSVVFVGAAILFFVKWEHRIKRDRALKALHELRALAHIVDMHQLTKDPESYAAQGAQQAHTTRIRRRAMTPFELNRYLDYCSDALALISKIAALYAQSFQDPVLLDAVDDVEDLTAGFSRKIWQKITILENLRRALRGAEAAAGPEASHEADTDLV
jgi:hypothetical protein